MANGLPPDPLAAWLERRDEGMLARATPGEVVEATSRWLEAVAARHPTIDADELVSVGFALLRSGHGDAVERAAASWLRRAPTPGRLDVAALLYQGLWMHRGRGGRHACPAGVEALLDACTELAPPICPSAWLAIAQAIEAVASPPLRARACEALRRAIGARDTSAALRDHLRAVLRSAERTAD